MNAFLCIFAGRSTACVFYHCNTRASYFSWSLCSEFSTIFSDFGIHGVSKATPGTTKMNAISCLFAGQATACVSDHCETGVRFGGGQSDLIDSSSNPFAKVIEFSNESEAGSKVGPFFERIARTARTNVKSSMTFRTSFLASLPLLQKPIDRRRREARWQTGARTV